MFSKLLLYWKNCKKRVIDLVINVLIFILPNSKIKICEEKRKL